jgi:hypothetical protein
MRTRRKAAGRGGRGDQSGGAPTKFKALKLQ